MKKKVIVFSAVCVCMIIGMILYFGSRTKAEYIYVNTNYMSDAFLQVGDIHSRPRWTQDKDGNFIVIGKFVQGIDDPNEYETRWAIIDSDGQRLESGSIEKGNLDNTKVVQEIAVCAWEDWIYRLYRYIERNPEDMQVTKTELRLQRINKNTKEILPGVEVKHDFTQDLYEMELIDQLYCSSGKVYIGNKKALYEVDEQGECKDTKFPSYQGNLVWDQEGNIYYIDEYLTKLKNYRLDTHEEKELFDITDYFFCGLNIDESGKSIKIQIKGNSSIVTYDLEGNIIGEPVVSDVFHYQKGKFYIDEEESFYFADVLNSENKSAMMKVSKVLKPEEYLECRSYVTNQTINGTLKPTIARWNDNNSVSRIEYNNIPLMGEYAQMIQKASTEILTKNAGDIIVLNGLPYKEYIDKGVLLPIELTRENSTNIHSVAKQDSKENHLVTMPLGMHLGVLYVNEPLLEDMGINLNFKQDYSIEEFFELVDRINETKGDHVALIPKDQSYFLQNWIVNQYYTSYIGRIRNIAEEDIENWLQKCSDIKDLEHRYYTESDIRANLKDERSQVVFVPGMIFNFEHYIDGYTPYPLPIATQGKYGAYPTTVLGIINENTRNTTNKFMNESLSSKNQEKLNNIQISINEEAFYQAKAVFLEDYPDKQKYAEKVEDLWYQVDSLHYNDLMFNEIMYNIQTYIGGEQDVDKTIKTIIQVLKFEE